MNHGNCLPEFGFSKAHSLLNFPLLLAFLLMQKMRSQKHIVHHFPLLLLLLLPSYVSAQEDLAENYGVSFTHAHSTIIIIILTTIFLFTAFLAVFLRLYSDRCFSLHRVPSNPDVTIYRLPVARGLGEEVIKSLPTYFYTDVKQHRKGKVELECAVCLNEFLDAEALRLLPGCNHVFRPRCIDRWLVSHVTCPICRQNLELGSDTTKAHTIIDLTLMQDESICPNQATRHDDGESVHDRILDHDEEKESTRRSFVGKFPRSHSTGHSLANSDRFTLRLPADVQAGSLVNQSSYGGDALTSMLSPRSSYKCGWFSMTPPILISRSGLGQSHLPGSSVISGSMKMSP